MLGGDELTELSGPQDFSWDFTALDDGDEDECDEAELGSFKDLPLWYEGPASSSSESL